MDQWCMLVLVLELVAAEEVMVMTILLLGPLVIRAVMAIPLAQGLLSMAVVVVGQELTVLDQMVVLDRTTWE